MKHFCTGDTPRIELMGASDVCELLIDADRRHGAARYRLGRVPHRQASVPERGDEARIGEEAHGACLGEVENDRVSSFGGTDLHGLASIAEIEHETHHAV